MKNIITLLLIVFTVIACKAQNDSIRGLMKNIEDPKRIVSVEVVQKAIEINLDSIKMLDYDYIGVKRFTALTTNPKVQKIYYYNYFSEKARKRMVELFEGKWSEEEIQSQINLDYEKDTLNPRNEFYKSAKKIAKRDSLPLQQVWDSMLAVRKNKYRKSIIEDEYVDYEVISIAGYLKDSRFLPYLKKMDKGNYVSKEVELALARYGEEPYLSNAIDRHYNRENFGKLAYICSKEAIEKIYEYAITKEGLSCDSNGMECYDLLAEFAMSWLVILFNSEEMAKEMRELKHKYEYPEFREPDKAYLKKMRAITEKYYQQFKEQEPDCENVPVDAW